MSAWLVGPSLVLSSAAFTIACINYRRSCDRLREITALRVKAEAHLAELEGTACGDRRELVPLDGRPHEWSTCVLRHGHDGPHAGGGDAYWWDEAQP